MTVRKKGNKWFCRFQINGIRYERACKGATDQKAAEKCEIIIKSEIMHGNYNFGKSVKLPRLKDITEIYLNYSKTNKKTYKNDIHSVNIFLNYWGNCELSNINPISIEKFKTYLKSEKGNKNSTINRHLQALSKMFNLAIDNKIINVNPLKQVKRLTVNNHKIRFLEKSEEQRLFDALDYHYSIQGRDRETKDYYPFIRLKPIIMCALQTGMRRGEILNLTKSCVDIKKGYIELLITKSNKVRKIPISEKLKPVLQNLLAESNNTSEYVFVNPVTGTKYTDIKRSFSSLMKAAQITNFRFHDFRHTVATRMVEAGIDLAVVQDILGHANIQTTMRYAHPVPERKKYAVNIL